MASYSGTLRVLRKRSFLWNGSRSSITGDIINLSLIVNGLNPGVSVVRNCVIVRASVVLKRTVVGD